MSARRWVSAFAAAAACLAATIAGANSASAAAPPTVIDQSVSQPVGTVFHYVGLLAVGAVDHVGGGLTFQFETTCTAAGVTATTSSSGDVTVTALPSASGTLPCSFTAVDGDGTVSDRKTLTITLTAAAPPTVTDQTIHQPVGINGNYHAILATGSTDPIGGPMEFSFTTCAPPAGVTLTLASDGTVTVHASGSAFTGTITCTFSAQDHGAQSNTATLTIVIADDVPVPMVSGAGTILAGALLLMVVAGTYLVRRRTAQG